MLDAIPGGNLRVPRDDFVAHWRLVEHIGEARPADWYVAGVAMTCRWLACAAVPSILGGWELAWVPVTERSGLAHEETIEAELFAAELQSSGTRAGGCGPWPHVGHNGAARRGIGAADEYSSSDPCLSGRTFRMSCRVSSGRVQCGS
jgi:hypothetical protein